MISVETAVLWWPWAVLLLWMAAFLGELFLSANVLSAVGAAGVAIVPPVIFLAWLSVVSPVLLKHSFRRLNRSGAGNLSGRWKRLPRHDARGGMPV